MNTFEKYINIYINIECLFLIENKSDVNFTFKIDLIKFNNCDKCKCDVLRDEIEKNTKKYIIKKIKENVSNVVEVSEKYGTPVKNILFALFLNENLSNIELIWSSSSLKEFKYVPTNHYIDNPEDSLNLRVNNIKFIRNVKL